MSRAEPLVYGETPITFEARNELLWFDNLRPNDVLEQNCDEKEEEAEEAVLPDSVQSNPDSVQSKALFHVSIGLPNSDAIQQRMCRMSRLHRHRAERLRIVVSESTKKPESKHLAPEHLKAAEQVKIQELLAKAAEALETHKETSPKLALREALAFLRKALETIQSATTTVIETRTVLETFDGYVDSIEGESAYVTLESRDTGDVLYGEFPTSDLLGKKIAEQTRFLCETVKTENGSRIDFRALPKIEVTDEEVRSIAEKMRGAFSSGDSSVIEY